MSHFETPRQPTFSFRVTVNENSSPSTMTSPRRQRNQLTPELEAGTTFMSASPRATPIDWKSRYENLQFQHQLDIERVRLHYEHELREKVAGKTKTNERISPSVFLLLCFDQKFVRN